MDSCISIVLHYQDSPEKQITVNKLDPISVLHNYVPDEGGDRMILAKNCLLMPSFSFKYHGIRNGDHMHVVRPQIHSKGVRSKCKEKDSSDYWNRRIALMNQSNTVKEAARLVDIRMDRIQQTQWRHLVLMEETAVQAELEKPTTSVLIPPVPSQNAPCCEKLPFVTHSVTRK